MRTQAEADRAAVEARAAGARYRIEDACAAATVEQLELYRDLVEAAERARTRGDSVAAAVGMAAERWECRTVKGAAR